MGTIIFKTRFVKQIYFCTPYKEIHFVLVGKLSDPQQSGKKNVFHLKYCVRYVWRRINVLCECLFSQNKHELTKIDKTANNVVELCCIAITGVYSSAERRIMQ